MDWVLYYGCDWKYEYSVQIISLHIAKCNMAAGLGGLTFENAKCNTWQLDWVGVGSPLATWPDVAHLVGLPNASEKRGGCNKF